MYVCVCVCVAKIRNGIEYLINKFEPLVTEFESLKSVSKLCFQIYSTLRMSLIFSNVSWALSGMKAISNKIEWISQVTSSLWNYFLVSRGEIISNVSRVLPEMKTILNKIAFFKIEIVICVRSSWPDQTCSCFPICDFQMSHICI